MRRMLSGALALSFSIFFFKPGGWHPPQSAQILQFPHMKRQKDPLKFLGVFSILCYTVKNVWSNDWMNKETHLWSHRSLGEDTLVRWDNMLPELIRPLNNFICSPDAHAPTHTLMRRPKDVSPELPCLHSPKLSLLLWSTACSWQSSSPSGGQTKGFRILDPHSTNQCSSLLDDLEITPGWMQHEIFLRRVR